MILSLTSDMTSGITSVKQNIIKLQHSLLQPRSQEFTFIEKSPTGKMPVTTGLNFFSPVAAKRAISYYFLDVADLNCVVDS